MRMSAKPVCRICGKRLTEAQEQESRAALERIATVNQIDPADLIQRYHPLCRLCRENLEQARGKKHGGPPQIDGGA